MTSVAVIGIGAMGSRMARRLLDAGHDLVVWNRTPSKVEQLVALGARRARTPAEAARGAEAVIIMVSDSAALRDVSEGADGVVAAAGRSSTLIQMSTVEPEATSSLASILPPGTDLLDAPVLGSVAEAEAGSLTIFAGGPPSLVARWTPLLSALGSPIHVGPVGVGAGAKLVANSTLFGVLCLLGEALALARGLGLTQEAAFDVLAATPLAAQAERRRPAVESGEYPRRFSLSLARKDADLILGAGRSAGADLRLASAAMSWIADADAAGWAERDYSAVLAYISSLDSLK